MEKQAPGLMTEAEKFLILSNIDRLWKEHLQALKFVQQAVGLRGYAQRDPLIEYKLEGYNLFLDMMAQIRRNVIYSIYQVCILRLKKTPHKPQCGGFTAFAFSSFSLSQFQPVLVKKDEDRSQNGKPGKPTTNGRSSGTPDPASVESSSPAASPQASA